MARRGRKTGTREGGAADEAGATRRVIGLHAVRHLLRGAPQSVLWLKLDAGRHDRRLRDLVALADAAGIRAELVDRHALDRLAPDERHQGAVAGVKEVAGLTEAGLIEFVQARGREALVLILDGVQDPHNLGACLRLADGGGVDVVIAPKDRAAALTSTARKVASGGAESVPFVPVTNLARTMRALAEAGVFMIGTSDDGERSIFDCDLTGPIALIMGGEASGLRRLTAKHCDVLARLPMRGIVESLNVSVTAGICVYEARRQRDLAVADQAAAPGTTPAPGAPRKR